jgi:hypothetical protein
MLTLMTVLRMDNNAISQNAALEAKFVEIIYVALDAKVQRKVKRRISKWY